MEASKSNVVSQASDDGSLKWILLLFVGCLMANFYLQSNQNSGEISGDFKEELEQVQPVSFKN